MTGEKIKVTYGKSMYEGWYADYFFCGVWTGVHASSKVKLRKILNSKIGIDAWIYVARVDN